ncbi:hypothetical protein GBA52_005193 [Prunus armeniaca]|nr:hypothetical protein GBA52_005193 [Prunus armeniaca]
MGFLVSLWNLEVYPKVKVRQQEDQDDRRAVIDFCFPEKEHQDVSPPTIARIPKSYVPSVVVPSISVAEGEMKDSKMEELSKQNIRASSIPRPRAVLSSPENDTVIGNKNRIKAERPSALKNHNLVKKPTQCVPCHITENSTKTKKSEDENSLKERKGSEITLPSQRRPPRNGKPSSAGNRVSFSCH